jgi:hypothetical protein
MELSAAPKISEGTVQLFSASTVLRILPETKKNLFVFERLLDPLTTDMNLLAGCNHATTTTENVIEKSS